MRAVLECAGVHDVLSKSLGSSNPINIVHATVAALRGLDAARGVAARRGLPIEDVAPPAMLRARAAAGAGADKMARLKSPRSESGIGGKQNQRETLRTLGLKRMHDIVVQGGPAGDPRHGPTVTHLVTVEEVD